MQPSKVFVLLFGSKGTVERNSLDTTQDAVVSIIDLRETISRQEYLFAFEALTFAHGWSDLDNTKL